ncbi:MAG: trigger factor [Desulfobacteraceae bacterium]|nr:trigger factor [Desulfobacteraceae bacterium]MCB9494722.1 trigger factor [Desulfobacteraceae bacterium]
MQVSVEDHSSVKKTLHIEISEDEVKKEMDNAYADLRKNVKINGFRSGKAPRSVLEAKFGKDVNEDVISTLVQRGFIEAAQNNDFAIIGQPEFKDIDTFDGKSAYKFDIVINVKPEIKDVDFKGLDLKKPKYEFSEEEVDMQLEMLRRNLSKKVPVADDRECAEGDLVEVNVDGKIDGEAAAPFEGISGRRYRLGNKLFSEGFDKEVIGMKTGDSKSFDVVFPEDYHTDAVKGKTVSMQVELMSILEEQLPELDDNFAKDLGNFETLEDIKNEIRANLKQGYEKRSEQELNEQVFDQLIKKVEFELPEMLVNMELEQIINEAERSFQANGTSLEQIGKTRESLREDYKGVAEDQVRRHLILDAVVNQEKLQISDQELEEGFEDLASNFNQSADFIRGFYNENPDKLDLFKHTLLEKKALKLIIDSNDVSEYVPSESEEGKEAEESGSEE